MHYENSSYFMFTIQSDIFLGNVSTISLVRLDPFHAVPAASPSAPTATTKKNHTALHTLDIRSLISKEWGLVHMTPSKLILHDSVRKHSV